jgi:hypothetical protein
MKAHICGTLKGWNKFLPKCFDNIERLGSLFEWYDIIISYDDHSPLITGELEKLKEFKNYFLNKNIPFEIVFKDENSTNIRTENISNARNCLLNYMQKCKQSVDYFIMLDLDNVNGESDIKLNVLRESFDTAEWDGLTFNRSNYYDIWALCFDEFVCSCFQFDFVRNLVTDEQLKNPQQIITYTSLMKKEITERLKNSKRLYPVYSAFNGFAVYKYDKYINCKYDWKIENTFRYFPYSLYLESLAKYKDILTAPITYNNRPSDCEHRHFHFQAFFENKANLFINPESIY